MSATSPPFDACAWDYEHAFDAQKNFIHRLAPHIRPTTHARLEAEAQCGGKAFGLIIAEEIANRSIGQNITLCVPRWQGHACLLNSQPTNSVIEKIRTWLKRRRPHAHEAQTPLSPYLPKIIRSSDSTEDWGNGESGVHASFPPDERSTLEERESHFIKKYPKTPYIIQEYYDGIGLVVDIAWSALLQRVVARLSWGREYSVYFDVRGRYFSSATWDIEGPQGLICPLTGEIISPLRSWHPLNTQPLHSAALVKTLYRAFIELDWPCGVQCELIVHPNRPTHFYLVQVRPSPIITWPHPREDYTNLPSTSPLLTTPSVSGAFRVQAPTVVIGDTGRVSDHPSDLLQQKAAEAHITPEQLVGGKIVIWETSFLKGTAENTIAETQAFGALGQIGQCLSNNTSHSIPLQHPHEKLAHHRKIRSHAHTLSTNLPSFSPAALPHTRASHRGWVRTSFGDSSPEALMVSDGLVGHVYLL